ncbi:hypothetical protein ERJ75_000534100 [Trypanosoma vivax]|nr:hypothetical protein ERJ75_000534100 [Trypanosoma vivax]
MTLQEREAALASSEHPMSPAMNARLVRGVSPQMGNDVSMTLQEREAALASSEHPMSPAMNARLVRGVSPQMGNDVSMTLQEREAALASSEHPMSPAVNAKLVRGVSPQMGNDVSMTLQEREAALASSEHPMSPAMNARLVRCVSPQMGNDVSMTLQEREAALASSEHPMSPAMNARLVRGVSPQMGNDVSMTLQEREAALASSEHPMSPAMNARLVRGVSPQMGNDVSMTLQEREAALASSEHPMSPAVNAKLVRGVSPQMGNDVSMTLQEREAALASSEHPMSPAVNARLVCGVSPQMGNDVSMTLQEREAALASSEHPMSPAMNAKLVRGVSPQMGNDVSMTLQEREAALASSEHPMSPAMNAKLVRGVSPQMGNDVSMTLQEREAALASSEHPMSPAMNANISVFSSFPCVHKSFSTRVSVPLSPSPPPASRLFSFCRDYYHSSDGGVVPLKNRSSHVVKNLSPEYCSVPVAPVSPVIYVPSGVIKKSPSLSPVKNVVSSCSPSHTAHDAVVSNRDVACTRVCVSRGVSPIVFDSNFANVRSACCSPVFAASLRCKVGVDKSVSCCVNDVVDKAVGPLSPSSSPLLVKSSLSKGTQCCGGELCSPARRVSPSSDKCKFFDPVLVEEVVALPSCDDMLDNFGDPKELFVVPPARSPLGNVTKRFTRNYVRDRGIVDSQQMSLCDDSRKWMRLGVKECVSCSLSPPDAISGEVVESPRMSDNPKSLVVTSAMDTHCIQSPSLKGSPYKNNVSSRQNKKKKKNGNKVFSSTQKKETRDRGVSPLSAGTAVSLPLLPCATPYTTPCAGPYTTPCAGPYTTPCAGPYTTPYAGPYTTPYAAPHTTPMSTQVSIPVAATAAVGHNAAPAATDALVCPPSVESNVLVPNSMRGAPLSLPLINTQQGKIYVNLDPLLSGGAEDTFTVEIFEVSMSCASPNSSCNDIEVENGASVLFTNLLQDIEEAQRILIKPVETFTEMQRSIGKRLLN